MREKFYAACALVPALLAGLIACGSDSKSSDAPAPAPTKGITSVPGTTQVSQMTPAQQQQASQDMNAYFSANITPDMAKAMGCGMAGLMMAGLQGGSDPKAACQSIYDQCMKSATPADAGTQTSAPAAPATSVLQSCSATVAQLNQCLAEEVSAFKALAASMNCNNAGSDAGSMQMPATPSCDAIAAQCPGIVRTTADAGSDASGISA
jgi:hypothetical protein